VDIRKSNIKEWVGKAPDDDSNKKVKGDFLNYLKKAFGSIPFAEDVVALYLLFMDANYPTNKKGVAVFALLYFISPIDLVPDALPIIGFLDDAGVIAAVVQMYNEDLPIYIEKAKIWLKENGFK